MRFFIFLVVIATFSCNPGKQLTKAEARGMDAAAICKDAKDMANLELLSDE